MMMIRIFSFSQTKHLVLICEANNLAKDRFCSKSAPDGPGGGSEMMVYDDDHGLLIFPDKNKCVDL